MAAESTRIDQELIAELEAAGGGDSPDVAQELEAALATDRGGDAGFNARQK